MQSLVPEQKSALAYLWFWLLGGIRRSVGSGVTEGCTSVFFACSNAILDASRIPIEENVAPLTVSIPSDSAFQYFRLYGSPCLIEKASGI